MSAIKNLTGKFPSWLLISAAIFFSILIILGAFLFGVTQVYAERIYPGVKINDFNLGGQTREQAMQVITGTINEIYRDEISFVNKDLKKTLPLKTIANVQYSEMADKAINIGRTGSLLQQLGERLQVVIMGRKLPINFSLNKALLESALHEKFAAIESPARNSSIIVKSIDKNTQSIDIDFSTEMPGTAIDLETTYNDISKNLSNLHNDTITLSIITDQPRISRELALATTDLVKEFLKDRELTLLVNEQKFPVQWSDIIYWLTLDLNDQNQPIITLDHDTVIGQLNAIAQKVNREPQDAKMNIVNNKATEFQASQDGLELDIEQSLRKIETEFLGGAKEVSLIINKTEPTIKTESLNDLGIKELIGVGTSDFSGSSSNRRHNIGVGAATLNGLLIKPGEEFSLMKALGSIDGQNGYVTELVIKGDKTTPEYGGGLCQVGTTTFRVALNAGLPITERRNHSYRVSYYEPAGTDATIYDPSPDLKFVNDTAGHILIQTKIIGNTLRFEFWGTSDGRQVVQTKPEIYNITQPGPTKIIETQELAPGQKKCTESAHAGADTVFYRTITTASGEKKEETWKSHYVPWQAVCLVGVEKPAEPSITETEPTPTPSESISGTN